MHRELRPAARSPDLRAHGAVGCAGGLGDFAVRDDEEPGRAGRRVDDALLPLDELDVRGRRHGSRIPHRARARGRRVEPCASGIPADDPARRGDGQLLHHRARRRGRPDAGVERVEQYEGHRDPHRPPGPLRLFPVGVGNERGGSHDHAHRDRHHAQSGGDRAGRSDGHALLPLDRCDARGRGRCARLPQRAGVAAGRLELRLDLHPGPVRHGAGDLLRDREGERGQLDSRDERHEQHALDQDRDRAGSVRLLTVRPGHRRSGSARRRDRHHEEPGPRLGRGLADGVLPVRERDARCRRRSARQPPGRSPPAKQLEHDQDHADDPGRDAGRQLLHHRGGR